jgi:hypothetical protein
MRAYVRLYMYSGVTAVGFAVLSPHMNAGVDKGCLGVYWCVSVLVCLGVYCVSFLLVVVEYVNKADTFSTHPPHPTSSPTLLTHPPHPP